MILDLHVVHAHIEIVLRFGSLVLLNQGLYGLLRIVELVQVLLEDGLLPVVVQEGVTLPQFLILLNYSFEELINNF